MWLMRNKKPMKTTDGFFFNLIYFSTHAHMVVNIFSMNEIELSRVDQRQIFIYFIYSSFNFNYLFIIYSFINEIFYSLNAF